MNAPENLKELTGQMMMAGFEGTELTPKTEALIADRGVGGLILFGRNFRDPVQLHKLIRDLQDLAQTTGPGWPLFITVDQEGGRVARLKEPFTQYPPLACLGRAESEDLTYRFACALGTELKAVGINMDCAPVLDVNSNPANPIIGDRAFSDNPDQVGRLACAFIRGFKDEGIINIGKHFPGHGDTEKDSHLELPIVHRDAETLSAVELAPFERAIKAGLESIMTAHVTYPAWDDTMPATFSPYILKQILRQRLGFEGVIISDDLEMNAVGDNFPLERFPSWGVKAGLDIFLVCHSREKLGVIQDQLILEVEAGTVDCKAIEASVQRIKNLKQTIAPVTEQTPDFTQFAQAHQSLADEMRGFLS